MSPAGAPQDAVAAARSLLIIAMVYVASTIVTATLAAVIGSPFVLWFKDTPLLILGLSLSMLLAGIVWDGLLIFVGLVGESAWRLRQGRSPPGITVEAVRRFRFLNCGIGPIAMLLVTGIAILGTSNITLMSLELLSGTTRWRDPLFWQIEGPLLQRIAALPIDTAAWDRLYHSPWIIELGAAFALVVIGRGGGVVLRYCVTMILLFYLGRLLGMLNPVMGPAFYRPDVFAYLAGSLTDEAMQLVARIMATPPQEAARAGGLLLGGVSAMPSLHIAMVAATAYWLAIAGRWTMAITIPWVLLVWASTVVLGWHYMLDGAGGIFLAGACVALTKWLVGVLESRTLGLAVKAGRATAATAAAWPPETGKVEQRPPATTR